MDGILTWFCILSASAFSSIQVLTPILAVWVVHNTPVLYFEVVFFTIVREKCDLVDSWSSGCVFGLRRFQSFGTVACGGRIGALWDVRTHERRQETGAIEQMHSFGNGLGWHLHLHGVRFQIIAKRLDLLLQDADLSLAIIYFKVRFTYLQFPLKAHLLTCHELIFLLQNPVNVPYNLTHTCDFPARR